MFSINFPIHNNDQVNKKIFAFDMQLFTAIEGKGAFFNGKPIKGIVA